MLTLLVGEAVRVSHTAASPFSIVIVSISWSSSSPVSLHHPLDSLSTRSVDSPAPFPLIISGVESQSSPLSIEISAKFEMLTGASSSIVNVIL